MKKLQLATDLDLPIEAVTEKLAFLGRTGTGKTYGAMKLAELMLAAGATIGAIDPVGVWRGLRAPAAKGGPSFDVVIFGGLTYDLPLEGTQHAGQVVADLVCDRGLSFVLDVSQMIPAEQQQVVRGFAAQFFQRKKAVPGAIHLFMEECQEFLPENPSGQEALTLGVMQRLWKLGRNYGIGGSLISQRPQEIAKKALNMSGTLFAFQMTGPHERKAVKAWIADHDIATDIESVLRTLKRGQPHVEMQIETPQGKVYAYSGLVQIAQRVTADLSSTPTVVGSAVRRPLSPIDVAHLKVAMAESVEKAKADDPVELRKAMAEEKRAGLTRAAELHKQVMHLQNQVAMLTRQAAAPAVATPAAAAKASAAIAELRQLRAVLKRALTLLAVVNSPALTGVDLATIAGPMEALREFYKRVGMTVRFATDVQEKAREMSTQIEQALAATPAPVEETKVVPSTPPARVSPRADPPAAPAAPVPAERVAVLLELSADPAGTSLLAQGGDLKPLPRAFLTALAQYDRPLTRQAWHTLADYTRTGDTSKTIGEFIRRGYVADSGKDITITDRGRAILGAYEPLPSGAALRQYLLDSPKLSKLERALLKPILDAYPESIERQALLAAANYTRTGDTSAAMGKFVTVGWITVTGRSLVRASDDLFTDRELS